MSKALEIEMNLNLPLKRWQNMGRSWWPFWVKRNHRIKATREF